MGSTLVKNYVIVDPRDNALTTKEEKHKEPLVSVNMPYDRATVIDKIYGITFYYGRNNVNTLIGRMHAHSVNKGFKHFTVEAKVNFGAWTRKVHPENMYTVGMINLAHIYREASNILVSRLLDSGAIDRDLKNEHIADLIADDPLLLNTLIEDRRLSNVHAYVWAPKAQQFQFSVATLVRTDGVTLETLNSPFVEAVLPEPYPVPKHLLEVSRKAAQGQSRSSHSPGM